MFFRCFATTLLLLSNLAMGADSTLAVSRAVVMAAPPGVSVTAGFLLLDNRSDSAVVLESVSAQGFAAVEIHKTQVDNGVARMLKQQSITIDAHSQLLFEPGGFHLMLYQPERSLQPGDQIALQLHTSQGLLKVTATVQKHNIF